MSQDLQRNGSLRATHLQGEHVEVYLDDALLARFRYGRVRRPHWHPLNLPDGRCVSLAQPHDHVWHGGLYHSPKFVDEYSLWEPEFHEARAATPSAVNFDPDHHGSGPYGELVTTGVEIDDSDATAVTVRADVDWRKRSGELLGAEQQAWTFHSPRSADAREYLIELLLRFTARGGDRSLWAGKHGYSGVSWRSPRSMDRGTILTDRGPALHHEPQVVAANWVDYTGALDGLSNRRVDGRLIGAARHDDPDRLVGVTLMSHPGNPTSTFFTLGVFGFLAAHVGWPEPFTLRQDVPVTARYAILVHAWPGSVDRIAPHYQPFADSRVQEVLA